VEKRSWSCATLLCAWPALACFCSVIYATYTWPVARKAAPDMKHLVVDVSAFPQGWKVEFGPSHPPPGKQLEDEIEGVYVQFVADDSGATATHAVLKYQNGLQAAVSFFTSDEFRNRDSMVGPWAVPQDWSYTSLTADRFRFGCAEIEVLGRSSICHAVAQYDEYVSVFRIRVSSESMPLEDLERILRAIDERMARQLEEGEQ
jgi:hypothetical protein